MPEAVNKKGRAAKACKRTTRPCDVHPRRVLRKSYSIGSVLTALAVALCLLGIVWSHALAYQVGFATAEVQYAQR